MFVNAIKSFDWKGALPVFRYALGATLILAFAAGFGNELSYIIPVLGLNFFAPGAARITVKMAAGLVGSLAVASFLAFYFSRIFLDFPIVFVLIHGLVLMHLFYTIKLNHIFRLWLLVTFLIIPMASIFSDKLGALLSITLVTNTGIAVLLALFVYVLLPSSKTVNLTSAKPSVPAASDRFISALRITLTILPVAVLSYAYQWSGSILILIFIAILSMKPQTTTFKTGYILILANLAGGIAAIIAFNLLVVVPSYTFLLLLTLLAGLYFGSQVFSSKPTAALYGTAFSTFLLVLGSVTASDGDAGEKVWSRIFQIGIAVTYTVLASSLMKKLIPDKMAE